jgi:hypothetical protein
VISFADIRSSCRACRLYVPGFASDVESLLSIPLIGRCVGFRISGDGPCFGGERKRDAAKWKCCKRAVSMGRRNIKLSNRLA